jgi:hypothetical protein
MSFLCGGALQRRSSLPYATKNDDSKNGTRSNRCKQVISSPNPSSVGNKDSETLIEAESESKERRHLKGGVARSTFRVSLWKLATGFQRKERRGAHQTRRAAVSSSRLTKRPLRKGDIPVVLAHVSFYTKYSHTKRSWCPL